MLQKFVGTRFRILIVLLDSVLICDAVTNTLNARAIINIKPNQDEAEGRILQLQSSREPENERLEETTSKFQHNIKRLLCHTFDSFCFIDLNHLKLWNNCVQMKTKSIETDITINGPMLSSTNSTKRHTLK